VGTRRGFETWLAAGLARAFAAWLRIDSVHATVELAGAS